MRPPLFSFLCTALLLTVLLAACGADSAAPAQEETATVDPVVQAGATVFQNHCATCHSITADTVIVGPSLAGIAHTAATRIEGVDARQYIEMSVLKPDFFTVDGYEDAMPKDFGKKLTGAELDDVVAYLLTLDE